MEIQTTLDLEKALSPIWRCTYYLGFTFDWCRSLKQRRLSYAVHCLTIFCSIIFQIYVTSSFAVDLIRDLNNPETKFRDIVLNMTSFSEQPLVLFVWIFFLLKKSDIQCFFRDWKRMEKQQIKGIHSVQIKRTHVLVYSLYYSLAFLYFFFYLFRSIQSFHTPVKKNDDLISSYYQNLLLNKFYVIWVKIQTPMSAFLYAVFFPLIDIVPIFVYYHAFKIIEALTLEVMEITDDMPVSKSKIVYDIWSRFEALCKMVVRADKLFGVVIILCHAILFFNICCNVFFLLNMIKNPDTFEVTKETFLLFLTSFILCLFRLLVSVCIISSLYRHSCDIVSAAGYFSYQRDYLSDNEERRITASFISQLRSNHLAAYPCCLYKIKPSIFLTLFSAIVTYTIILMQTNDQPGTQGIQKIV